MARLRTITQEVDGWHIFRPQPASPTSDIIAVTHLKRITGDLVPRVMEFAQGFLAERTDNILPIEVSLRADYPDRTYGNVFKLAIRGQGSYGVDMELTQRVVIELAWAIEHSFFAREQVFAHLQRPSSEIGS